jgi:hypothetical protein
VCTRTRTLSLTTCTRSTRTPEWFCLWLNHEHATAIPIGTTPATAMIGRKDLSALPPLPPLMVPL